jgi:hypothetical protein
MDFSLALSFVALIATFYQAHLQRVHNQKSVKPLPQIDLMDRDGEMYVHVVNNGVGPMTVDKLRFTRDGKTYDRIQDCLSLDPQSYYHVDVSPTNKKVIIPGGHLIVFGETLDANSNKETINLFRQQLAMLSLDVEGHDIYNNKVAVSKNLNWFGRHL